MLKDLLHGFEVLSTTEETLIISRNASRLVQNNCKIIEYQVKSDSTPAIFDYLLQHRNI